MSEKLTMISKKSNFQLMKAVLMSTLKFTAINRSTSATQFSCHSRCLKRVVCLPMRPEQMQHVVDRQIVKEWAPFTISQRRKLVDTRYSNLPKLKIDALRQVYAQHAIRYRKLKLTPAMTQKQLDRQAQQKLDRLPPLIDATLKGCDVYFLDEAMFTSRSILERTWISAKTEALFEKQKLSFDAIGVLCAIDLDGKLVAHIVKDGAIKLHNLLRMSRMLKAVHRNREAYIFLDNLNMHRNPDFVAATKKRNQHLLYNAVQSSRLNPIERLFAHAKRTFGREVFAECDLQSQADVRAYVAKSLVTVPSDYLLKHIITCFKRMLDDIDDLQLQTQKMAMNNENMKDLSKKKHPKSPSPSPSKLNPNLGATNQAFAITGQPPIQAQPNKVVTKPSTTLNERAENLNSLFGAQSISNDPVQINISDLTDLAASKKAMYRALAQQGKFQPVLMIVGQIFLPEMRNCPVKFLQMILTGDKDYFLNKDVPYVYIEKLQHITVKNVLDKVYTNSTVRKFLPDFPEHPEKHISREYLFSIVNRLDSTFFSRACIDVAALVKPKPKPEHIIDHLQIKPDLLKVLKEAKAAQNGRVKQGDKRALASMLSTTKKRKRPSSHAGDTSLPTEIIIKRFKA